MEKLLVLIKNTLLGQIRRPAFVFVMAVSLLLGLLCVPGMNDGYQIFYLGGVRGIYNSAWLGAIAAVLPTILLWLPGFYLLRSQITEDRQLKIGQITASTPISNFRYIGSKFICNFAVLILYAMLFTGAVMLMQIFRGESTTFQVSAYLTPLFVVTVPYLFVLASLTILMDVLPSMKHALGNFVAFSIWIVSSSVSAALPDNPFDLFGIGYLLNNMLEGARSFYPQITDHASFGYYPNNGSIPAFEWTGIKWEQSFLYGRFMWIGIAILLVVVSAIVFDRFKTPDRKKELRKRVRDHTIKEDVSLLMISPVKRAKRVRGINLLTGEMKIMWCGKPAWWYVSIIAAIILSYFVVPNDGLKWVSLIMLLPIGIWSQSGCLEKIFRMDQLIYSSCPRLTKWFVSWSAGIITAFIISGGILSRFAMDGRWQNFITWCIGALFVSTLALVSGNVSGNRRLFEGIYLALIYFGPLNNMWRLDFLGVQTDQRILYLLLFLLLTLFGISYQLLQNKSIKKSKGNNIQ